MDNKAGPGKLNAHPDFANPLLTDAETASVIAQNGRPCDYVVMPCDVQFNPQGQLGLATVPTPNGPVEVVIVSLALALPVASLRMSRLLDASGRMPHPLEGMLPMLTGARLVVPRARLSPELAAHLAGEREALPANTPWPDDPPPKGTPGRPPLHLVNR